MAAFTALPVIQKEAWAQCENPNCQKWRKLHPGVPEINEDEPWYCYLNPDTTRNTCSASEVDYDENQEIVIAGMDDPEEAARNRAIMEDLEASIAAAAAAAVRGRGKGRGGARGRGRGARGRGRPPLPGGGVGGRTSGALPSVDQYGFGAGGGGGAGGSGGGSRKMRTVSFAEGYDVDAGHSDVIPGRHGSRITKRQVAKYLQRLVQNQGEWDVSRGGATAVAPAIPSSLPSEAWEALGNAAPDTAELACAAADLASSVRYFEGTGNGAEHAVAEAGALARLGAVLAASSGLIDCQDALTKVEKDKLGLDEAVAGAGAPLPNPAQPLDINNLKHMYGNGGAGEAEVGVGVAAGDVNMVDGGMVEEGQQLQPAGVLI